MRHSYRCHAPLDSVAASDSVPDGRRSDPTEVMDVARCPCCRTPLIARMGRHGPYFHCLCRGRNESHTIRGGKS